ncbi:hypothetical protein [Aeromicrobium sp. UC242_57]|uniref:AMP-binding enzyme n=1 Tax=Aeromicrobium sp. UC242_57 TaxID=3374624 RepID=UPI0037B87C48
MDPDTGQLCETGVVGEVVTRGPGVTQAYWRNPSATADAFWPDGWFRTGDAGYMDAEGYVFLKDRIKDLLMSGGENIYPAEVENAIMAHPAVQEVAVIGVPSEKWGETPLAVVVPKAGETIDEAAAHRVHPRTSRALQVPDRRGDHRTAARNPSGKVLKRELRAPVVGRAREEHRMSFTTIRQVIIGTGDMEKASAQFQETFGLATGFADPLLEPLGIDDQTFRVGPEAHLEPSAR